MWKDFNIDEYAPTPTRSLRERPSSASGSYQSNKENTWQGSSSQQRDMIKSGDSWSPIITIPKPFKMTLREEKKQKTKTKVCFFAYKHSN